MRSTSCTFAVTIVSVLDNFLGSPINLLDVVLFRVKANRDVSVN